MTNLVARARLQVGQGCGQCRTVRRIEQASLVHDAAGQCRKCKCLCRGDKCQAQPRNNNQNCAMRHRAHSELYLRPALRRVVNSESAIGLLLE